MTLCDIYKEYKEECNAEGKTPLSYSTFRTYCEYGNMELVNAIIFEAKEVLLPYRMGSIRVMRHKRKFDKPTVNHGETAKLRKQGIKDVVVYFTDSEWFSFKWLRYKSSVPYKSLWGFYPTHGNKNSIGGVKYILSQALQTRPDLKARYFDKETKR
jgi:hypothetical protein